MTFYLNAIHSIAIRFRVTQIYSSKIQCMIKFIVHFISALNSESYKIYIISFMVVADSFFGATAEGQWKIKIGLLSIVIGTNCVHPQYDFFIFLVLKSIYKQIIRSNCIRKAGLKTSRFDATYNVIVLITSYKNWKQQETQNKQGLKTTQQ